MARALIIGGTGQDGSYLAEFLLAYNYEVAIITRRSSSSNMDRISHILSDIYLYQADLLDQMSMYRVLRDFHPHEVYNLAAMSHVQTSFSQAAATAEYNGIGVLKLLEAIRCLSRPSMKFYQASTSEMYGNCGVTPQHEETPFSPCSPYGISKLYAHHITQYFREAYGMFCCCGILFNHESPRRGIEFVTRKISDGVARIKMGLQDKLELGNIDSERDWGYAGDYVKAMVAMLQHSRADDYVIASGETHSVREFARLAFEYAGLKMEDHIVINPSFFRLTEVPRLRGDATKARTILNWEPAVNFDQLVALMVESDIRRYQ